MRLPFIDLAAIHRPIQDRIENAITQVVASNRFILGPEVEAFEAEVAAFLGVGHAIGVSSGSDALVLALMAHDVGPGDEVVTTPFSFIATAEAVTRVGATPVFADIDPESFNLDPVAAAAAVTQRTKAILPVHLYGRTADMDRLHRVAEHAGLPLVEDAAQAIGAEWGARRAGGLGSAGCFSFFPTKNLGALGDGGLVTTHDAGLAARLRRLRVHGHRKGYIHDELGANFRLDAIQAAVLRVKLAELEGWTETRRDNAIRYRELFYEHGLTGGEAGPVILPGDGPGRHVWHQFVIRLPADRRADVFEALGRADIGRAVYYPVPLHQQPSLAYLGVPKGSLPESERAAAEVLALPIAPGITPEEQDRVVRTIAEELRR